MSGSTASAPKARARRYDARVCSGRYPLAPRCPMTSVRGGEELTRDRIISLHDRLREVLARAPAGLEVLHLLRNPGGGERARDALPPAPATHPGRGAVLSGAH